MGSRIDKEKLYAWCRIPVDELENHPDARCRIKVFEDKNDVSVLAGNMMADEVIENNKQGRITKWILPAGPMGQYEYFAKRVNEERISLKNVYVFHMDELLDWETRPFPVKKNGWSYEGLMRADFYGRIDPELNVPEEQRFFPRISDMDAIDKKIEEMGGVDTLYGGLGYKGLVAFCEAPTSPYFTITEEEYANSKTRIVKTNDDNIISLSQREVGGLTHIIPPFAITLGFKSMLNTKKAVFMITTGEWKRTAIRMMMFSEPTVEYPGTLFTKYVPDVLLLADRFTALPPLQDM